MGLHRLLLPLALAFAPLTVAAQGAEPPAAGQVQSPILTIDVDRLLAETRFGQRLAADLRERTETLAAENERLRVELVEEERSLTERRPTMEVDAFRAEAEAFDTRVQRIRAEQDAKQRDLADSIEQDRRIFLDTVRPVLGRLMLESGAAVILDRREVFLIALPVDITDEAIAAIDAELGDGGAVPPGGPEPAEPGNVAPEAGDGTDLLVPEAVPAVPAPGDGG